MPLDFERCQQSQGWRGLGSGRGHDPGNCRRFETLGCSWILKGVNNHRDGGGRGRNPNLAKTVNLSNS